METAATRRAAPPVAGAPHDSEWQSFWQGHSVASEIAMADFYGLRHVLLKFLPRHGVVVEAGCGLGRYVFYLRALGLRTVGCDVLLPVLRSARRWALQDSSDGAEAFRAASFCASDVRRLPFRDESVSGYISLGVIEHFPEGPAGALAEAYRVLRPGGIAIVEVPSALAFDGYVHRAKRALGRWIGRAHERQEHMHEEPLAPAELGALLRTAGFGLLLCRAVDLIYPAWSLGIGARWYGALHRAERTPLGCWGGLAVAVGIKRGGRLACFVCGADAVSSPDLGLPCCDRCRSALPAGVVAAYRPDRLSRIDWHALDREGAAAAGACCICGSPSAPNQHFGDWGFASPVCVRCRARPAVNMELAHRALKRVWRARGTPA